MSARAFLEELVARLRLTQDNPSLLLLVFPDHADLAAHQEALLALLGARGEAAEALAQASDPAMEGPARWVSSTKVAPARAHLLCFAPPSPLTLRAALRTFNAQREELRSLAGPLLLLIHQRTESEMRRLAPDFFSWTAERYLVPPDLEALGQELLPRPAEPKPRPPQPPIRFLHLSDLHLRPDRRYDQDRVLRGLLETLRHSPDPLDLIFVSGDLANSGKASEYLQVTEFLRKLLEITKVNPRHLFVVPGNHDADRDAGRWLLRTLSGDDQSTDFFTKESNRRWHGEKFTAYEQAMKGLLGADRPVGLAVGAKAVEVIEVRGQTLAVASFNSAWFAQADDDQDRLWLGEANVDEAGQALAQAPSLHAAIALLHHPLDWLAEAERSAVENYLDRAFDIVLRGHLHQPRVRAEVSGRGGFLNLAGPAAYQGSKWPNGCFVGELDVAQRQVRLTPYSYGSGADPWTVDTKVFPRDEDHRHTFQLPARAERGVSLIEKLLMNSRELWLRLEESEWRTLLSDLELRLPGGSREAQTDEMLQMLTRQGRLGELWDWIYQPKQTSVAVSSILFWGFNSALRLPWPEPMPRGLSALLAAFSAFWMAQGRSYLAALGHVPFARQSLIAAFFRHASTNQSAGVDAASAVRLVTNDFIIHMPHLHKQAQDALADLDQLLTPRWPPGFNAQADLTSQSAPRPVGMILFEPPAPDQGVVQERITPGGRKVLVLLLPLLDNAPANAGHITSPNL